VLTDDVRCLFDCYVIHQMRLYSEHFLRAWVYSLSQFCNQHIRQVIFLIPLLAFINTASSQKFVNRSNYADALIIGTQRNLIPSENLPIFWILIDIIAWSRSRTVGSGLKNRDKGLHKFGYADNRGYRRSLIAMKALLAIIKEPEGLEEIFYLVMHIIYRSKRARTHSVLTVCGLDYRVSMYRLFYW